MVNFKRVVAMVMVVGVGLSTTACNETTGYEAGKDGSNSGSSNNGGGSVPQIEEIDMASIDADLDGLEKAMADVEAEIGRISLPTGVRANGIDDSIDKGIRKLFDALIKGVDQVDAKVAELRARVNAELAKLDPLNPLHIVLVMKLQDYMKYLDKLEAEVDGAFQRIVDLIDAKVADVDRAIAKMDQGNPLTWVAWIYWNKIRATVMEYRALIAAKIGP